MSEFPPGIPIGFRFDPTDQELLGYFLYNKYLTRTSSPPPPDYFPVLIPECNLYGSQEPWEIWETYKGNNNKNYSLDDRQDLFFFAKLTKRFNKGSRNRRTIGSGTWEGETSGKKGPVMDPKTNALLGWKKRFRYENKRPEMKHEHGGWIMLEYNLNPDLLPPKDKQSFADDHVLCRIRKNQTKVRKPMKRKRELVHAESSTGEIEAFRTEDSRTTPTLPAASQPMSVEINGFEAHHDLDHDDQTTKKSKSESSSNDQAAEGDVSADSNYCEQAEWFAEEFKFAGNRIQMEESDDQIPMLSNYELFSWQY